MKEPIKPKKILFVCARIPYPVVDGGAHAIYTMLKALNEVGHDIYLVAYESSKHAQDRSGIEALAKISSKPKLNSPYGPSDFIYSLLKGKPASIVSRFDDALFDEMMEPFEGIDFDVILYAGLQTCAHLEHLKKIYPRAHHLLYQVNVEHLLYQRIADSESNFFKRKAYSVQANLMRKFEFNALKMVDEIIFISPKDQIFFTNELGKLNGQSILPPALLKPLKNLDSPANKQICAYADWRWTPNEQGLSWFFNLVWPKIKKACPEATLKIAGKHLNSDLLSQADQLGGVEYIGFVDDLSAFIKSSDLMIAALPSGSGIKIKLVEAMAHTLPFVTTKIGFEGFDHPELAAHCVAENATDFAEKCAKLLNDSDLNKQIRSQIYQFASTTLDPQLYAQKLHSLIEKI